MDNQIEILDKETELKALEICKNGIYKIETSERYGLSACFLKEAKALLKSLEEKEKELTTPINVALKKIRERYSPYKEKLRTVIDKVNLAMTTFRRNQEEIATKQNETIQEQANPEDIFIPEVKAEIPKTDLRVRKVWKFEVVDKSKINEKFMIPDEKTIGELARKLGTQTEDIVGGIKVFFTETAY